MALSNAIIGEKTFPAIPDKDILLQRTYLEAIQANYDSAQRWTRWKEDHEQLKATLATLPDRLTYDIVIPFGSKALMKAKLVHTNEVLTSLGEKWFIKQSCKQAVDMCVRRITQSEQMLKDLESERSLLWNRQMLPKLEEAFPSNDAQEIIEEFDESKEAEWRVQHRQREKESRKKLAELRKKQEDKPTLQSDEDLFRRLDELELEEELNDELERLHAEYEEHFKGQEDTSECSEVECSEDENSDEGERYVTFSENTEHPNSLSAMSLKEQNSSNDENVINENLKSTVQSFDHAYEVTSKVKKLTFAPNLCMESSESNENYNSEICIKFRHSDQPSSTSKHVNIVLHDPSSVPKINSPSDIFDYHKALSMVCHPKSILKSSPSTPSANEEHSSPISTKPFGSTLGFSFEDPDTEAMVTNRRDLSHLPPVLSDVRETSLLSSHRDSGPSEPKPQRPMSLFRATRHEVRK